MRKLIAIVALTLAGCGGGGGGGGGETPTVETPVFSPAAGTYHTVQSVTITCATAGAAIHYTTDASTPTSASPTYAGAIAVNSTTTIKAMATAAGKTDSAVASATYTLQAATPVISPPAGTYATAQSVTITSATPGAVIHYTTDGSAPTAASPTYAAAIPLAVGEVAAPTTIKAIALATGFADSAVASSTFVMDATATPAAAPTFAPPAGTYTSVQAVTISTTTAGATIYYTTDGGVPSTASTVYSTPVQVAASLTLRAIAAGGGHTASPVASAAYVINSLPVAATPTFDPGAGSYPSARSVTIASATPGAVIYYTADGSPPTAASTLYAGPVLVDTSRTLKAIATAVGYSTSAVGTATYVIGGGGGGTTFLDVCNGLIDTMNSLFATCLHANPALVPGFLDSSTFLCADRQSEIDAGLITYNAAQGAACDAALQAFTCAVFTSSAGFAIPAACNAALVGAVGTGGTCWDSADCATGYCTWELQTGTCPGTCQPFTPLGGPCTDQTCAEGQVCDGLLGSRTCKAESAAGGACPCQANLWCDSTDVCRAFLPVGSSCTPGGDPCNILSTCAGTPATCRSWVGLGATCDPADSLCGLGYECSAATNACVSWPTVGEPCPDFFCIGSYCDFTAASPTCKALLAAGATCNPAFAGTDCASGFCNASSQCERGRCFR